MYDEQSLVIENLIKEFQLIVESYIRTGEIERSMKKELWWLYVTSV